MRQNRTRLNLSSAPVWSSMCPMFSHLWSSPRSQVQLLVCGFQMLMRWLFHTVTGSIIGCFVNLLVFIWLVTYYYVYSNLTRPAHHFHFTHCGLAGGKRHLLWIGFISRSWNRWSTSSRQCKPFAQLILKLEKHGCSVTFWQLCQTSYFSCSQAGLVSEHIWSEK